VQARAGNVLPGALRPPVVHNVRAVPQELPEEEERERDDDGIAMEDGVEMGDGGVEMEDELGDAAIDRSRELAESARFFGHDSQSTQYTHYERELLGTGRPSYSPLPSASRNRQTWQMPHKDQFLKAHVFVTFVRVRDCLLSACHCCSATWQSVDFLLDPALYQLLEKHSGEELEVLRQEAPSCEHQTSLLKVQSAFCRPHSFCAALSCDTIAHPATHSVLEVPKPSWLRRSNTCAGFVISQRYKTPIFSTNLIPQSEEHSLQSGAFPRGIPTLMNVAV
jgi:hypothetical protein